MKNKYSLLIIALLPVFVACMQQRNDFSGFYGNVKEVIEQRTISINLSTGEKEFQYDTCRYDKQGRLLEENGRYIHKRLFIYDNDLLKEVRDSEDKLWESYKYDLDNLLVENKLYSLDGSALTYRYYYDDNKRLVKQKMFDRDDELDEETIYEYNTKGYKIAEEELSYISIGRDIIRRYNLSIKPVKTHNTFSYDKKGNMIEERHYGSDDELRWKWVYQYNNKGDVIREEHFDYEDAEKTIRTYTYKYDRKGNWVHKTELYESDEDDEDIAEFDITRTITYY